MKLTDWIKQIITPLVEKPEDADLFLSASDLKAVEVPDNIEKAFNTKYLTRERAIADEEIIRKTQKDARGYVFGSVDQKLKHLISKFSTEDQAAINGEMDTLLKIEKLSGAIENLSKNEDVKKASEAFRKKEEDLHKKISDLEINLKEKDTNFAKERSGFKVDYFLRNKIAGLKLATEFAGDDQKEFLAASTIDFLKKNYHLEFDDVSSTVPLRKMVDNAVTDVYEGNTKLTLDDVLKKKFEPFIEKNNSTGATTTTTHTPPTQAQKIPTDQPLTVRDRINANA